ncbi:serine/threonine protein kinase [Flavobacterium sp. 28A]|uniref:helix-hairpin-helix domain-containing protein n=1 Tax=Flavobacterium sp. 28A TaxID=2735895 RepID=UPI001570B7CE|nr:kinase [Flavobacterium sp. 28A]NRT16984.1 serine/threonine protein kinase [Flavobacterium sp. 28A]
MKTITVQSINDKSKSYQFVDNGEPMRGGVKDVYFSPDKKYVVAIYRDKLDFNQKERLQKITNYYLPQIKNKEAGDYYLNEVFRWPTDIIDYNGLTGIIVPLYHSNYFFKKGYETSDLIKDNEKEGKWYAGAKFRNTQFPLKLAKSELGDWLSYFQVCVNLTRGVKKMHAMGLAHSDLSYKNVLIDPVQKTACIIDLDGLVVPGMFPAEVIGTAEFIAPEVLASKHLNKNDPNRKLPNRLTDLHALPILIYMFLLHRHPLKGGKVHDLDTEKDDLLSMGEKALFIEHPTNAMNRPKLDQVSKWDLPWADVNKLPYTLTGPYLKALFDKVFIDGLHNPMQRPTAEEWEIGLLKTTDLMQKCYNSSCEQKWYVFDNTNSPKCPFCGTPHKGTLPILDLYYQFKDAVWKPENHRLMVYDNQYLFQWHINRNTTRNEKLSTEQKVPVGYFTFHNNKWVLVNQKMTSLRDVTEDKEIPIGSMVELTDGKKLLLSKEEGGRVVVITMANK